ncbi:MAG: hypothetical protein ACI8X5_002100 [Planctomycetota bacterium]|jgi:hypothetical protein
MLGLLSVIFLLGLLASTLGGGEETSGPSIGSNQPDGRRAFYLLLDELGFDPLNWKQAPISLPRGDHLLWMPESPADLLVEEEDSGEPLELNSKAIAMDPRHPVNYAEFVRAGGTLVIPWTTLNTDWLRDKCGLELPNLETCAWKGASLQISTDTGESMSIALTPSATLPPVEMEFRESWDGAAHERSGWHDLANGADGPPFASWCFVGHGRVVALADDRFLRNELIAVADNGLFAVRLAEALAGDGGFNFDEFALGHWVPTSKAELLASPGVLEVSYHVLLGFLLFVLVHAWAREFKRDPHSKRLNPRLRVSSQAGLYGRAQRYDLLGHELRLGGLRRLAKHLGRLRSLRGLGEDTTAEELAERATDILGGSSANIQQLEFFRANKIQSAEQLEDLNRKLDELEKLVKRDTFRAKAAHVA